MKSGLFNKSFLRRKWNNNPEEESVLELLKTIFEKAKNEGVSVAISSSKKNYGDVSDIQIPQWCKTRTLELLVYI